MSAMKCFGYYIVKPLEKPKWLNLEAIHILSVGSGLSDTFPDLAKCFWTNYPESDRIQYKKKLQLTDAEFTDFCNVVSDLFNSGRMAPDTRFAGIEDALKVYGYLKNVDGYRVVGLFTGEEIFDEYEKEGTFSEFKEGEESTLSCTFLGCDILGCESGGNGSFYLECYLINSLNEEIEKYPELRYKVDCETGLIADSFSEVGIFCDRIQGMGEPVVWAPFEVHEYQSDKWLYDSLIVNEKLL